MGVRRIIAAREISLKDVMNIKEHLPDYSCHQFKLYLIEDGLTLKRKIRVEIENTFWRCSHLYITITLIILFILFRYTSKNH